MSSDVDSSHSNVSLKTFDQSWKLDCAYGEKPHVEVKFLQIQEQLQSTRKELEELAEEAGMSVEELRIAALGLEEPDIVEAEAVGSS